jgi:hypothetical protein
MMSECDDESNKKMSKFEITFAAAYTAPFGFVWTFQ